jgi:hypothetical protein
VATAQQPGPPDAVVTAQQPGLSDAVVTAPSHGPFSVVVAEGPDTDTGRQALHETDVTCKRAYKKTFNAISESK